MRGDDEGVLVGVVEGVLGAILFDFVGDETIEKAGRPVRSREVVFILSRWIDGFGKSMLATTIPVGDQSCCCISVGIRLIYRRVKRASVFVEVVTTEGYENVCRNEECIPRLHIESANRHANHRTHIPTKGTVLPHPRTID